MTTQTPIEITPEMIEAGCAVLRTASVGSDPSDIAAELVEDIFVAMHARLTAAHDEAVRELVEAADYYRSQFGQALEAGFGMRGA